MNQYAKAVIAILSAGAIALQTVYPTGKWHDAITAAVGAFLVWYVPNSAKATTPPVKDVTK